MMPGSYRLRLRAVISDYHRAGDPESNHAASILCDLFCANLAATAIVPALDTATGAVTDAGVVSLLRRARERLIGERITTPRDDADDGDALAVARAFNDQINVALCDVEHRRTA